MNHGIHENFFEKKIVHRIASAIKERDSITPKLNRPLVTLSFAQSLDGSLTLHPSAPVKLSNHSSMMFTHLLRSIHDAILIGIGTLLADDPLLTVRLISGRNPQPVVVDSYLRAPLNSRLIQQNYLKPWIASSQVTDLNKEQTITGLGGKVFKLPALENGWVNLPSLLEKLHQQGIRSLMVEGGSRIISSFLQENLADQVIMTIVPVILGGFRSLTEMDEFYRPYIARLRNIQYELFDDNLIVYGFISV